MKKQREEEKELKKDQEKMENEAPCSEETCQCDEQKCDNADKKSDGASEEECHKKGHCKEKIAKLEAEKKDIEAKLAKEKDDYVRLMAEFDTFRRRTSEEKLALVNSAAKDTIKGLLPVLDDCERAMELLSKSSDEAAKEGTALIYDKLMKYLKSKGLEKIEAKGQKFDTDFHEAVAQVPVEDEDKKGLVYDVIETGYMLGGKILRYAKVVVGI